MAPASTGRDNNSNSAVRITDHGNIGTFLGFCFLGRMLIIVAIKFAAPRMDLAPAKCREKIVISTGGPLWAMILDKGGYTVHPVPAPFSTIDLARRRISAGIRSHSLILFIRGKVMSGEDRVNGDNQFPNPPIITGITRKKIMRNAWDVTRVLYSWSLPRSDPGRPSSVRISILIDVPDRPAHTPKRKYKEPMSLWLTENNHRDGNKDMIIG